MADRALCRSACPVVSRGILRQFGHDRNYNNGNCNNDHNIEHYGHTVHYDNNEGRYIDDHYRHHHNSYVHNHNYRRAKHARH
jgi:hypothetical protein